MRSSWLNHRRMHMIFAYIALNDYLIPRNLCQIALKPFSHARQNNNRYLLCSDLTHLLRLSTMPNRGFPDCCVKQKLLKCACIYLSLGRQQLDAYVDCGGDGENPLSVWFLYRYRGQSRPDAVLYLYYIASSVFHARWLCLITLEMLIN